MRYSRRSAVLGLVVLASICEVSHARMGIEQRVRDRRSIEEVYWRHRIWPEENPRPKPALRDVLSDLDLRDRVEEGLRKSSALETLWGRPITAHQLQAEIRRMAKNSKDPSRLREIWSALGNDPKRVQESLARPLLADRLLREAYAGESARHASKDPEAKRPFDLWWSEIRATIPVLEPVEDSSPALPPIEGGECAPGTWIEMSSGPPVGREGHAVIWTGAEMILWGGRDPYSSQQNLGGARYDPATDAWGSVSGNGAPAPRYGHTGVWTGDEMIVWGGRSDDPANEPLATGGRYDPASGTWTPMSTGAGSPGARDGHTAVWTGTEMIVWGGGDLVASLNTGARYSPATDVWVATSTNLAPDPREQHTAVWTGSEMIVWGGIFYDPELGEVVFLNTGGRYSPSANQWSATTTPGAPSPRRDHTAVWTGSEMIVWGGTDASAVLDDGARYDPARNRWTQMGVSTPRFSHTAVWTGTEMLLWGGSDGWTFLGGERYEPVSNSWSPIADGPDAPTPRFEHTAVWTGSEMIVWGGNDGQGVPATGGRFTPATSQWSRTSSADPRPSAREGYSVIWTGGEMIVWGGQDDTSGTAAGARYDPATDTWSAVSSQNSTGRVCFHTVIWTGTEMIVWGGDSDCGSPTGQSGGGRYDPVQDLWADTSLAGAPTGRLEHSAVWTGERMVVWGGRGWLSDGLNDGAMYDPATDTWQPTTTEGAPAPRYHHSAVWSGGEMIVWGGFAQPDPGSTGGRYDPISDEWGPTDTTGAPSVGDSRPSAIWAGDSMLMLNWADGSIRTDRYDPGADRWEPRAGLDGVLWIAQDGPSAVRVCGGMVARRHHLPVSGEYLFYSAGTDAWTSLGAPLETYESAMAAGAGRLLLWSGQQRRGLITCVCDNPPPPPGRVVLLKVGKDPDHLSWADDGEATGYDVIRGRLADLRATNGDFQIATEACLADGTSHTFVLDPAVQPPGGFFYLVRVSDTRGNGTYDTGSRAQVAPRDAAIAASGMACP